MSENQQSGVEAHLKQLRLRAKARASYLEKIRNLSLDEHDPAILTLLTNVRPDTWVKTRANNLQSLLAERLPWWQSIRVLTVLEDIGVYQDDPAVFSLMETGITGGMPSSLNLATRLHLACGAQGWGQQSRKRIWLLSCEVREYVDYYFGFWDWSKK